MDKLLNSECGKHSNSTSSAAPATKAEEHTVEIASNPQVLETTQDPASPRSIGEELEDFLKPFYDWHRGFVDEYPCRPSVNAQAGCPPGPQEYFYVVRTPWLTMRCTTLRRAVQFAGSLDLPINQVSKERNLDQRHYNKGDTRPDGTVVLIPFRRPRLANQVMSPEMDVEEASNVAASPDI